MPGAASELDAGSDSCEHQTGYDYPSANAGACPRTWAHNTPGRWARDFLAALAHADEPGVQVGLLRRRRASVAARVTVAYAARAVGSIPLMSGGLLVVEAVLVPGLVSGGMTLASAICAMLIYRLISWIFIAAIGWVVFFLMFRTEKDGDPDAALQDEDAEIADPPQFMPDPEAPHEPEP